MKPDYFSEIAANKYRVGFARSNKIAYREFSRVSLSVHCTVQGHRSFLNIQMTTLHFVSVSVPLICQDFFIQILHISLFHFV